MKILNIIHEVEDTPELFRHRVVAIVRGDKGVATVKLHGKWVPYSVAACLEIEDKGVSTKYVAVCESWRDHPIFSDPDKIYIVQEHKSPQPHLRPVA